MVTILLSLLFLSNAHAVDGKLLDKYFSPFKDKVQQKLYKLEDVSATSDYRTKEGQFSVRVAKAVYDVSTDLGTIAAHGLGVSLPAHAVVKQVWFYTETQFVDAGAGTVALSCEDANNLYSAADVTGIAVGTTTAGVATGTAATMVKAIAADCEITATVAGAAQTAGKMTIFVEYVVSL